MKERHIISLLALLVAVLSLTACSEEDNTKEEYPDWQANNEKYFDDLYNQARQKAAAGDDTWKTYSAWTLDGEVSTASYDHIVVHVLKQSDQTVSPYLTDTVRVHYKGQMLPSTSYPTGYVFDQSYRGTFNAATAIPTKFAIADLVSGFTTALLHMHLGDVWEVYIPYQLGYGEEDQGAIPAYSTLKFEVNLVGIYRKGTVVPEWKAKANPWADWADDVWQ